jgi:phosphate/sulfate permease
MRKLWLIPLFFPILAGVIAYIIYAAVEYGWTMAEETLEDWGRD